MWKLSLVLGVLAATTAAAFAPSTNVQRRGTALSMSVSDRRATFTQIGAAVLGLAVIPSAAVADGAASAATKLRARGIYGSRIAALKSSVASGNIDAIADEKNAFVLFNSGAYTTDRARRQAAIAGTNEIFAAVRSGDKSAVKKAYDAYMKANDISELPSVSKDKGQGAGGDYDYRARTPAGAIYVR